MKSKLFIIFGVLGVAILPVVALAGGGQGFTPLVGIPGLPSDGSFDGYVDALYALAISIAALVAVVKIVLAGTKYMMDDIVTHKSEAKQDIKNALIGLLIIIGAVIILNTINSDLTNLAITAPPVELDNDVPRNQLSLEDALREGYCNDGNGCQVYSCNSDFIAALDENEATNCQQRCNAVNGFYDQREATPRAGGGTINTSVCAIGNNQISQIITGMTSELIDQYCPDGKNCYAESCDNYGTEYRSYSCSGACTDGLLGSGLGGVYYDSVTNSCIFVGPVNEDETIPCQYRGCQQERNRCSEKGGYVSNATEAPLQIRCRIPERQDSSCPPGQVLEEAEACDAISGVCYTTLRM